MARIQTVAESFSAVNQATPWIKHDYYQDPFCVSLAFYPGSGLAGTFAVQYILDDMSQAAKRQVLLSQSTTVITIADGGQQILVGGVTAAGALNTSLQSPGHGLAVADYVELAESGQFDGGWPVVTVPDAQHYTFTSLLSQTVAAYIVSARSGRVQPHATMTGMTARTSGNYAFPVWASRLVCTAFTSAGVGYLVAMQGGESS